MILYVMTSSIAKFSAGTQIVHWKIFAKGFHPNGLKCLKKKRHTWNQIFSWREVTKGCTIMNLSEIGWYISSRTSVRVHYVVPFKYHKLASTFSITCNLLVALPPQIYISFLKLYFEIEYISLSLKSIKSSCHSFSWVILPAV